MPWEKELCATFYVARPSVPAPAGRMLAPLELIGVTGVRVMSDPEATTGRWADMRVEVRDRALDVFRGVAVVFPEPVADPRRRGGGRPAFWGRIAEAFCSACTGLHPVAAFVTDVAERNVDALVAEREQWLVEANAVPLLHEGFALLHLSADWFADLEAFLDGLSYRRLAVPGGTVLVGVDTGD